MTINNIKTKNNSTNTGKNMFKGINLNGWDTNCNFDWSKYTPINTNGSTKNTKK